MSGVSYEDMVRGWSPDLVRVYPEGRFHFLRETGSTNDDLLAMIRGGNVDHLTTVMADHQRAGRGRRGDKWEAPPGTNLLFSLALRLPEDRTAWTRLPHLAAKVIGEVIETVVPGDTGVQAKWPNDLLIGGRKLGGILVETVLSHIPYAVVGVGLNINMRRSQLPEELQPIATSLYEILGCESSRSFLLGLIVQGFIADFPSGILAFEPVRGWLEKHDFLKGKRIRVTTSRETSTGRAVGLGADGELLLELEAGGVRSVISSEKIEVC